MASSYKGKHIILLSDKLTFVSRKDSVDIFGKKYISLCTKGTLNLDVEKSTIINSPEIFLGLDAEEPLLLGNKWVSLMGSLINAIEKISVSTPLGPSGFPINISEFDVIKNQLKEILSKQNKTK
jgi:hypothetical protein